MESKEKATELYNKFYNTSSHPHHVETRQQIAKQCALIAVDEILNNDYPQFQFESDVKYWEDVKQEIEKL